MRIDYYLSRVFHQLSFSALVGASIFDYIGALDMTVPLASKAIMWPGFVVLFTGLYKYVPPKHSVHMCYGSHTRVYLCSVPEPPSRLGWVLPRKRGAWLCTA